MVLFYPPWSSEMRSLQTERGVAVLSFHTTHMGYGEKDSKSPERDKSEEMDSRVVFSCFSSAQAFLWHLVFTSAEHASHGSKLLVA